MGEADEASETTVANEEKESTKGDDQSSDDADAEDQDDLDASAEDAADSDEEVISPETPEESEEGSSDTVTVNNVINSAGNSESVITYKSVDETDATKGADTATIEWKQGCVNGDKLVNGKDLRFTVAPVAGRKVTKVEITIDGTKKTALTPDPTSGIYKVDNGDFSKKETVDGKETTKALSAEITITTTAQTYTVTFDNAEGALTGSYEIWKVTKKAVDSSTNVKVLDTEVTASVTDAAFDTAVEYAVVIPNTANKFVEITAADKAVETKATELNKANDETTDAKTPCYTFSLKPSDYVTAGDEGFTVKVKAVKKAELTAVFAAGDNFTVTAPAATGDDIVPYVVASSNFGAAIVEKADGLATKKLAFKVTPVTDYKITGVTAKAVAGTNETALTVTRGTADTTTGAEEDTIALAPVKDFETDTEITITVETAYSNDAKVHAISFKAATGKTLDHVKIALTDDSDAAVAIKDNAASVIGDTANVTVSPDPGYEFAKATEKDAEDNAGLAKDDPYITIIKTKSYPATTGESALPVAAGKEESKVKVTFDGGTGAAEAVAVSLKGSDAKYDGAASGADPRDYIVTSVEVVIDSSLVKNTEEKIVVFIDRLKDGYDVTTEGVINDETADNEENTWVIPEGVDELEFTVTTTDTPSVTCDGFDGSKIDPVSAEGGVYAYSIPTSAIDASSGTATIIIEEADDVNHNVNVTVDTVSNVKSVKAEIDGDKKAEYTFSGKAPEEDGSYKVTTEAVEGKELVLNFTPVDGAKITKLSYTMGEGEEAAAGEGTVAADGTASLTIESVKADVAVSVESASDYTVKLEGAKITGKDGAYKADYTVENITVTLVKTGTPYAQRFYDIIVKDGNDVAATDAVLAEDGTSATIAKIAKEEYGKTLTIEIYIEKGKDPYKATLETTAYSEAVTVTRVDTGKVVKETDTVGIMADSRMEFTLTPAKGAKLDDLEVEILSTKENAAEKDNTDAAALLETAVITDGKLILQAKPAAEAKGQVLVSIYNKNEEADKDGKKPRKSLTGGKFVVDLTDPVVKTDEIKKVTATVASATNRTVRVNLNVEFKNKKNPPAKPAVGALYYKVEVDAPTGAPKEVTPVGKSTQYVKITDFSNPAVTLPIDLVESNSEDKDGIADIAAVISSSAKVSLVQSLSGTDLEAAATVADADYVAGPETLAATAALATKLPVYETKLSVKAVNGATVFTGQWNAKVATPSFTKETSYDNIYVQFVNSKTGKLLGASSAGNGTATDGNKVSAWVEEDNSIHVAMDSDIQINYDKETTDYYKNLGVKVTAVGPDDSYRASAVVKLKVQQGIFDIAFDESKATLPKTLYKESDKKAASVKMTVQLNYGEKAYKPAKSTVAWSVAAGDGASDYEKAAVEGKKPLVSVKNGTLTVSKDYRIQDTVNGDTFTVTVKAADYVRTDDQIEEEATWLDLSRSFTITGVKNTIAKVVLLDGGNNILSTPLSAETFDNPVYVAAVSSTAKEPKKGQTYSNADFLPVTFKSSAKAAVDVEKDSETNKGVLIFHKPGTKIKISASTVDGGKVQKMDTAPFDVNGYNTLGLTLVDTDNVSNAPGTTALSYAGGSNQKYGLYLAHKNGDDWGNDSDYKSVKVTVKGGKFIANKSWAKGNNYYLGDVIVVSDLKNAKAEITLTDTATKDPATKKNKTYTYTITNTNNKIADKAPSIKMIDPKKPAKGSQTLTWQITAKDKNNYAGSYVLLAPDHSVTASNYASVILGGQNGTIRKIDENGQFTLENVDLYAGGSYKMIATVGTLAGGNFMTTVKDAKISFSVPKDKKLNENLSVTANYSLDPQSAAFAKIVVKTDRSYTVSPAMNVIKKAKDQGKNAHTNDFTTYFEVKGNRDEYGNLIDLRNSDETYAYIGLKDTLSAKQIVEIMDKAKKDDCTGYITVDNGVYRKDVQIKISFKTLKYTVTGASVFESKSAVTPVVQVMSGKVPVKAAFAKLDPASDTAFAKEAAALADGTIAITSQAATTAGKYDVKLLVVPEDSRYIRKNASSGAWERIDKGETTTVTPLTEDELYALAVPVTAKIEVKALDTKKVVNIKSTNVTLNTGIYTAENGNGYQLGDAGKTGSYVVDIPYTFVAGNTEIGANATDVAVNLVDKDGKNLNEIGTDKELLVKASKQTVTVDEESINVIRLEVSKKALVALTKMDSKAKPITAYGKKLAVPVVIKYTNGVKEETVKFNITMPKKAPKEFKDVVADVKAAELNKTQSGNRTDAASILGELVAKVIKKAEAVIAADTDVIVGHDPLVKKDWGEEIDDNPTDPDGAAEVIDSGKAKIALTLTNNAEADAAKKTETVDVECTFVIKHSDGDVALVESAIETAKNSIEVDNNTTADSLREAIKKVEVDSKTVGDYLTEGKGNLSLAVLNFNVNPATAKGTGTVTATIKIKDILDKTSVGTVNFNKTISQLQNISEIKDAVETATNKDALDAIVDACSGQEDLIKKAVLAAARKEAEGNPDIEVDFAEFKFVKAEARVEADSDNNIEAKDAVDGQVSYTLVVKNTVTGRTMKCDKVISTAWTFAEAAKYISAADAAKLVEKALKGNDNDYQPVKTAAETADNNGAALKTAVLGLANTALAGVEGYECNWKKLDGDNVDFTYTPADSQNKGKLKFTLVVQSKNEYAAAEAAGKAEVAMSETAVLDAAGKYESAAELKAKIEKMSTSIEVDASVATAEDSTAAVNAIKNAVKELKEADSELNDPTVSVDMENTDETKKSVWTKAADVTGTATLTNVKITIDAKTSVTVPVFTFTVKASD